MKNSVALIFCQNVVLSTKDNVEKKTQNGLWKQTKRVKWDTLYTRNNMYVIYCYYNSDHDSKNNNFFINQQ